MGVVLVAVLGRSDAVVENVPVSAPSLPPGMSVDGCRLARVRILDAVDPASPLSLHVRADRGGEAEPGERLESVRFAGTDGVLQIGLRDCDWLSGRAVCAEWATYEPDGVSLTVTSAPAGTSIYVSVAWRAAHGVVAEDDLSTWFAIDQLLPE